MNKLAEKWTKLDGTVVRWSKSTTFVRLNNFLLVDYAYAAITDLTVTDFVEQNKTWDGHHLKISLLEA